MRENLEKLLQIAEDNVKSNPSITTEDTVTVAKRYLHGLRDEVAEVEAELKDNNSVHLADELSDIAWDYFVLLKICEERGWIHSVEDVFAHGLEKYSERAPAFLKANQRLWNSVKASQKEKLAKKHQDRHG
jgi:NTP pyrophosphatase (non-canonical NTP hydrolase)